MQKTTPATPEGGNCSHSLISSDLQLEQEAFKPGLNVSWKCTFYTDSLQLDVSVNKQAKNYSQQTPKCSLSVHAHAYRRCNRQSAKWSSKAQFQCHRSLFFRYYSLIFFFGFLIFSIQSGCDRSGWRWSQVWRLHPGKLIPLKHLHVASRPDIGPTYIDSKCSLWVLWWVNFHSIDLSVCLSFHSYWWLGLLQFSSDQPDLLVW